MPGKDGADEIGAGVLGCWCAWVLGLRGNVAFCSYEIVEKWKSGRVKHGLGTQ